MPYLYMVLMSHRFHEHIGQGDMHGTEGYLPILKKILIRLAGWPVYLEVLVPPSITLPTPVCQRPNSGRDSRSTVHEIPRNSTSLRSAVKTVITTPVKYRTRVTTRDIQKPLSPNPCLEPPYERARQNTKAAIYRAIVFPPSNRARGRTQIARYTAPSPALISRIARLLSCNSNAAASPSSCIGLSTSIASISCIGLGTSIASISCGKGVQVGSPS